MRTSCLKMGGGPCGCPGTPPAAASAAAETAAAATTPDAPRAEEADAGRRPTRYAPESPASTPAGTAAEELVQNRGEIGGLGVLHRVDERLAPRALLGRDVE